MGKSRKYPYPTTEGFHVLIPPPLPSEIPKCVTPPPCPQNSIIMNPLSPSEFPFFFLEVHFRLSNAYRNKWTWIYASSRLRSIGARWQALLFSDKTRLCKLLFKSEFGYKINTTYGNFTPLCFLVLFWRLQSKIVQIQTTVQMLNNLAGVPWKEGTGASFLLFIAQE